METERIRFKYDDLCKETERRLYRLPQLIQRISYNRQEIRKIEEGEIAATSRSIVRTDGRRHDRAGATEAKLALLNAYMRADSAETSKMKWALRGIRSDSYYGVIEYKYFRGMSDDDIAEKLSCNASTVRRNKTRLIKTLTNLLYGANESVRVSAKR